MEPRRLRRHRLHYPLNHHRKKAVEASREMVLIDLLVEEGADPNPLRRQKMVAGGAMEPRRLNPRCFLIQAHHLRKMGVEEERVQGLGA